MLNVDGPEGPEASAEEEGGVKDDPSQGGRTAHQVSGPGPKAVKHDENTVLGQRALQQRAEAGATLSWPEWKAKYLSGKGSLTPSHGIETGFPGIPERLIEEQPFRTRDDDLAVRVADFVAQFFGYFETPEEGPFFIFWPRMQLVPMEKEAVGPHVKMYFLRFEGLEVKDRWIRQAIEVFQSEQRSITDLGRKVLCRVGVDAEGHRWLWSGAWWKVLYRGEEAFRTVERPELPFLAGRYQKPLPEAIPSTWGPSMERLQAHGMPRVTQIASLQVQGLYGMPGRVAELLEVTGLPPERDLLVYAWMVQAWMPETDLQALLLIGEARHTSYAQSFLRDVVDPSTVPTQQMPRQARDVPRLALEHYLLAWEHREVIAKEHQRQIVEILKGQLLSWSKKKQRYNPTVAIKNPVILSGYDGVITEEVLAQRTLTVEISPRRRQVEVPPKDEAAYLALVNRIYSGLMALLGYVHARLPSHTRRSVEPEWQDYFAVGELVADALGRSRIAFWNQYEGYRLQRAVEQSESRPVVEALLEWLRNHASHYEEGAWVKGTIKEWLSELKQYQPSWTENAGGWPQSPRAMGSDLERALPVLRALQIECEKSRQGTKRGPNHRFWIRMPSMTQIEQLQEFIS